MSWFRGTLEAEVGQNIEVWSESRRRIVLGYLPSKYC